MSVKSNLIGAAAKFPSTQRLDVSVIKSRRQQSFGAGAQTTKPCPLVLGSILDSVGNTPLVKLNKVPAAHNVDNFNFYVKCEFLNPGGSIKDRIGIAMMDDAKKNIPLKDQTILEGTSGNTGIAVVMNASLNGHKSLILTKKKCSDEKLATMRLMGADIVLLKDSASEIAAPNLLVEQYPGKYLYLDQFENETNPIAHHKTTGPEIYEALKKHNLPVDAIVMVAGTGGTMTGISTYLKEQNPDCLIVAGDIDGSNTFHHGPRNPFLVEGILGDAYPPITLDKSVVDRVEVVSDKESFLMARELAKKEGLLCGGSSGMAMAAAVKFAKRLNMYSSSHEKKIKNIIVILPDGIRNYMSKFVLDQWMEAHFFIEPPIHDHMKWYNYIIQNTSGDTFVVEAELSEVVLAYDNESCGQVFTKIKKSPFSVVVVIDHKSNKYEKPAMIGTASADSLRYDATNPTKWPDQTAENFDWDAPITDYMEKYTYSLYLNRQKTSDFVPTVGLVSRMLDIAPFVVLGELISNNSDKPATFTPKYLVSAINIINFIKSYEHNGQ